VAILAASSPADARPLFPGILIDELGLTCTPQCSLCHTSPSPGTENAEQWFALNLKAVVSGPVTVENLPGALKALENEPCRRDDDPGCMPDAMGNCTAVCDADGTGEPDIKELRVNTNPNNSDVMHCPQYGCGAHVAPVNPKRPIDGTAALAALGAVAVLVRRWRR
jgi:MYXO-CTERM domain-containing protein